jgi:hypothetical protein
MLAFNLLERDMRIAINVKTGATLGAGFLDASRRPQGPYRGWATRWRWGTPQFYRVGEHRCGPAKGLPQS